MNQIELYSKITEHLYPLTDEQRTKLVAGVYQSLWKINDKRLYALVNTIGDDLKAFGCTNPANYPGTKLVTINPLDFDKDPGDSPLGLSYKYNSLTGPKLMDFAKRTIVAISNHFKGGEQGTTRYKEALPSLLEALEKNPALTVARIRVLLHDENVNLKTAVFRVLEKETPEGLAKTMMGYIWYADGSSVHSGLLREFEELL